MKKILFSFLSLMILIGCARGENFSFVEGSACRYKDGLIYTVKNTNKNIYSILFANNINNAKILYYDYDYKSDYGYSNLLVNLNSVPKRNFDKYSKIQSIQSEILSYIDIYKKCSNSVVKTTNSSLDNYFTDEFLKLSVDEALTVFVPDYKIKNFIKQVKKTVKQNLKLKMPTNSYNITIKFFVNTTDGNIEDLEIINRKSLTKSQEKMYLKAINKSNPFKVPDGLSRVYKHIPIKMPFNWKVYNLY